MRGIGMRLALPVMAALALAATPAAAQDEPTQEEWDAITEQLGAQFAVEPLSAEQQARLPQAKAVIARIMPPGVMQEMMGGMFNGMLGPLMEAGASDPTSVISARFGYDMTASAEAADEAAAILDPAWGERRRREMEVMPQVMGRMMAAMEPVMRDAMAELYAVHFTTEELTGIDRFFATPIGATYARKSFSMTSDPRLMGAVMQAMPQMYTSMASMEAELAAATADLPPERTYADMSKAERSRLAELIGVSGEELESYLDESASDDAGGIIPE